MYLDRDNPFAGRIARRAFCAVLWLSSAAAFASGAPNDHTVLIFGGTVSGGASSREAFYASAAGYTVEVVDDAGWNAKSSADFATYRAVILGDPTCTTTPPNTAINNQAVWGPAINGNVIAVGTDEVYHQSQGGDALTQGAVGFAASEPGKTGAMISLSCYYHGTAAATPVPLLNTFGTFTVTGVGCYNNVHIVASHPALSGITDSTLSNWSCSVHEAFDSWPANFQVLAIARDIGSVFTASDGSVGTPYILARGSGLISLGITLSPAQATNLLGTNHTVTATLRDSSNAPVADALIGFRVTSGPNTGTSGTCLPATCQTSTNGQVSWTYTGDGGVGVDAIQAFQDSTPNGVPDPGEPQATAQKTWTTCGDGVVQSGEACDPAASPSGCSGTLSCLGDCTCGCIRDSDCDDGDTCTTDTCTTATGACTNTPIPDCTTIGCGDGIIQPGEACDPAASPSGCPGTLSCLGNCTCICSSDSDCDDGNVCTDDRCDGTGACTHVPNTAPCDDGMFCTVGDTCAGGACGTPRDCSAAGDQCNNGVCNEAAGACEAQPKADSTSCNDGDACTTADHCSAGSCVGGPPPSCDDGNACTVDSCTAGSCVHVAISGDSDGDGYADCQENAAGCNPYDSTEIPLQADASLGVPTEGHRAGNRLVTYAAPPLHRRTIKVASEPSCATSGVCGGSGFCTAGKIGDPCTANAQCNQPANVCRLVVNFSKAPGLRIVDAKLNRQPVPGFTPVAPGCSRKVDVALNLAQRRSQRLRIKAVGTVGGRSQFDRDRFWYVR